MKRVSPIVDSGIFFLLGLLTFLLILESFVHIPGPLQILGRMHPVILHLPVGFIVVLALLPAIKNSFPGTSYQQLQIFLLQLLALSLALAATAGFFLAQEPGYQSELIDWHKWTATGSSYLAYALLILKKRAPRPSRLFAFGQYACLLGIVITGHLGGSITHGQDYLLAPLKKENTAAITPESSVFTALIQPVFEAKCTKCHNSSKQKGQLSMASIESMLAGGENGPIWEPGDPGNSHLLQRIHLPLTSEEHMPPEDQPQLSAAEIQVIEQWIQSGADFDLTIGALAPEDSLALALTPLLEEIAGQGAGVTPAYPFKPASAETIKALNTPYRTVSPIAQGSPALSVAFFIEQAFQPSFLEELTPVRKQVVAINLSNMPIGDAALQHLGQFPNLEKIVLNGTKIRGSALAALRNHKKLRDIALSNTAIQKEDLLALADLPELQTIYAWETQLSKNEVEALNAQLPGVHIELGYRPDPGEKLQLSPPLLGNNRTVLNREDSVILKTKFPGAVIRYTTDGSKPDSLSATVFSAPFPIKDVTTVKARTFCDGWLGSETATLTFFPEGQRPDSTILLSKANPAYQGEGARTLSDKQKGSISNFRHPAWLGYQENPMSVLFDFGDQPPRISKIVGSFGQNLGPEIFLPKEIKVYGGAQPGKMQLLGSIRPPLPDGYQPNQVVGIPVEIEASTFQFYQVDAFPYPSLPKWHQNSNSGRKTWVFADEIFFY